MPKKGDKKDENKEKSTKVIKNSGQFVKGHEKKGGRPKGTPNKRTLDFIEQLGDFNVLKKAIALYNTTADENIQWNILKELLKYIYPQRKAIEVTARENNMSMAEFMQGLEKVSK